MKSTSIEILGTSASVSMDDKKSTKRSKALRVRRSAAKITRWEIPVSELTRAQVELFATQEGLTPGVAAEKLLLLGIAAHLSVKEGEKTEPEFVDRQLCPEVIQQIPENPLPEPNKAESLADLFRERVFLGKRISRD